MNGNGMVFWLEGNEVCSGELVGWRWTLNEEAVARVKVLGGRIVEIWAEDIFLSQGAAMKEIAKMAGV